MTDPRAIRAWAQRWRAVGEQAEREAARLSPAERLVVLSQLFVFARSVTGVEDDTTLWERLQRLREHARRPG
jgi:hypothetical protein